MSCSSAATFFADSEALLLALADALLLALAAFSEPDAAYCALEAPLSRAEMLFEAEPATATEP